MADYGIIVPPGQSPPFSTITPTNHSSWIIISTALGLCMSLLFAAIRVFIHSATKHAYGKDDYLLAAATLLASVQSILLLSSCANGLGRSKDILSQESLDVSQQKYYASNILFTAAVALSKASVACFLLQLTPVRSQRRFIHILLGLVTVWGLAFFFAVALVCNLSRPWALAEQRCAGYFLRWQVMETLGCILEAAMFGTAVWLVWGLRTSRSNKIIVVIAFAFRLLMIVIVTLRLDAFDRDGLHEDPTIRESQFITWTSTELHYSLVSATIPILRSFMSNLSTNYGAGQGPGGSTYGQGTAGSHNRSALRSRDNRASSHVFELRSIAGKATKPPQHLDFEKENCFPNTVGSSRAYSPSDTKDTDAGSTGSNESQKMIIRKDITWQVQRNDSNP